jgi:hypothetical protein
MAYEMHIARTKDWLQASTSPITEDDVNALIKSDSELGWSTTDYVDARDDTGAVTRYFMIMWAGKSCFWWDGDQIRCANPDEAQQLKLAKIARDLNAFAVGDDGERYEIRKNILGKEKLVTLAPDT